jgi:hypothetical protein
MHLHLIRPFLIGEATRQSEQRLIFLIKLRFEHAKDVHVLAHTVMDFMLAKYPFLLKTNALHQSQGSLVETVDLGIYTCETFHGKRIIQ